MRYLRQSVFVFAVTSIVSETICYFRICGAVRYLGYEADWRDKEDHEKRSILIINPSQTAASDGIITGWHVYTTRGRRSQVVHLQVWRPLTDPSDPPLRYLRVNETAIAARWVGHNFFALWPRDRIYVQRGDVVGIFFPGYNPIPWSVAPCSHGGERLLRNVTRRRWERGGGGGGGGEVVEFERSGTEPNPCRRYSLNATIMDRYEVEQYDYEYELTTDGRYERRPYGPYLRIRRYNRAESITFVRLPPLIYYALTPVFTLSRFVFNAF